MKKERDIIHNKIPIVIIDPSLEKYRHSTPFPEKLAQAKEMLKTAKLPDIKKYRK